MLEPVDGTDGSCHMVFQASMAGKNQAEIESKRDALVTLSSGRRLSTTVVSATETFQEIATTPVGEGEEETAPNRLSHGFKSIETWISSYIPVLLLCFYY